MKKSLKFHLKKGGSRRRGSRRRGSRRKSMRRRSSHRRRRTMRGGAALSPKKQASLARIHDEQRKINSAAEVERKRASAQQRQVEREAKKADTQRIAEARKAQSAMLSQRKRGAKQSAKSQLAEREAICIQQCKDRYRPRRRTPGAERARARTF